MNTTQKSNLIGGACYMVAAGAAFAVINAISYKVTSSPDYGGLGFRSQSDLFWQYGIALLFSLPFLFKQGLASLRTTHPVLHVVRVILSVIGLQAFNLAFSYGEPTWKVVALVMTSPFFVMLGAKFLLGETVGTNRWMASIVAFTGGMIVLQPWSTAFHLYSMLPVVAALFWGAVSLMTKYFTAEESPVSLTVWLLLLLTPINALFSGVAGFEVPTIQIFELLVVGGALVLFAQWCLTKSYAAADAAFVQPFDDLKLISNVLVFGLGFMYWPEGQIWIGLGLILVASSYLLWSERGKGKLVAA